MPAFLAEIVLTPPDSSSLKGSRYKPSDEFKVISFRKEFISHKSEDRHRVAKYQGYNETTAHDDHRGYVKVKQIAVLHF
jgi:hypothetical protein